MSDFDVIIVGGGPAGLSAALILGRCRRRVLVCDAAQPRNACVRALHTFLTRNGVAPLELLRLGREEVRRYGVEWRSAVVTGGARDADGFAVTLADGARLRSSKLVLATGSTDHVPAIEGLDACYGLSVFHCPYCHGWEVRDRAIAVYGRGRAAAELALALQTWSVDVAICTDGPTRLTIDLVDRLRRDAVTIHPARIARLEHDDGRLHRIVFAQGPPLEREAFFVITAKRHRSELAVSLGCKFNRRGVVRTGEPGATGVAGLYVVGDASRDAHLAIVAAAEGAKAGMAINMALQKEAGPF